MTEEQKADASQMWWDVFGTGGAPVIHCSCGRTHFASGAKAQHEEGELEALRMSAATAPNRYIEDTENDAIGVAQVTDTMVIAYRCQCLQAFGAERFLNLCQERIFKYYERKRQAALAEALALTKALSQVADPAHE